MAASSSNGYIDPIYYENAFSDWTKDGHKLDPFHPGDYYSKSTVAKWVLDVSPPTMGKMLREGLLYEPFHKKNASPNARGYYTLTDLMRISIIQYGSIKMQLIYNAIISSFYGHENDEAMNANRELFFTKKSQSAALFHSDISNSFQVIKHQIVEGIIIPVDLSPHLIGGEIETKS